MAGLRVVGGVQADGFAVVVHGHVNMAANGLLDAGAGAAAAGKQIHHQLVVHGEKVLIAKHGGAFLVWVVPYW